jgi:hypothetical protein
LLCLCAAVVRAHGAATPSPQPEVLLTVLEPVQQQASTYNITDSQGQRFECRIGLPAAAELQDSSTDDVPVAAIAAMMQMDTKLQAALDPLQDKCTRKEVHYRHQAVLTACIATNSVVLMSLLQ